MTRRMNEPTPLIKCRQLTLGYGSKDIVRDLDYEVNVEDYLCIIGRNGSGKTTFLRGLAGLLSPRSGSIELCDGLKRSEIGFLPQMNVIQKDFPASVEEIVLSAFQGKFRLLPLYGRAQRERAKECMARTRTESLRKSCFRKFAEVLLPRTFGGSKAACAFGPSPLCRRSPAASGRTRYRPGPRIYRNHVPCYKRPAPAGNDHRDGYP